MENMIWPIEAAVAKLRARSVWTLRDPALTWGGNRREFRHNEKECCQLRRLLQNAVRGQFGPCASRLSPGAGRRGRARSELTSQFKWCSSPHFQRTPVAIRQIIRESRAVQTARRHSLTLRTTLSNHYDIRTSGPSSCDDGSPCIRFRD